jgi:ATP-binding cassette subfamily F protein 3
VRELEERLHRVEGRRRTLQARLADPDLYAETERGRLQSLLVEQGQLERELAQVEADWITAAEALEAAQAAD